jgi:hypothetical protein
MREKLIDLLSVDLSGSDGYEPELIADHLIANGVVISNSETTTKWIPVTERLPEKCEPVLACFDFMGGKVVKASDRYGKNGLLWSGIPCGGKVTHWMPLPQPPKGE